MPFELHLKTVELVCTHNEVINKKGLKPYTRIDIFAIETLETGITKKVSLLTSHTESEEYRIKLYDNLRRKGIKWKTETTDSINFCITIDDY